MSKQRSFSKNLVRGFKGFLVGLTTSAIMAIPLWFVRWVFQQYQLTIICGILMITWIVFYFELWGFFANKFWKWE